MKKILEKLLNNEITIYEAENYLKLDNLEKVDEIAMLDSSRENRTGFPEAIFADGKDIDDLKKIVNYSINHYSRKIILTHLSEETYFQLSDELDQLNELHLKESYNKKAKLLLIERQNDFNQKELGRLAIISAGTSDIPVAEEARIVAEANSCEVFTFYDVGVAGIHRLFTCINKIISEDVSIIIAVAGMEGALPSVVAGMVDIPVIAVPTSIGYGVGEGGKVALNSMLQSCSPGIATVNIDNGFGAAAFAVKMLKQMK